jgi:adenylylsulfate kinase-like enzyme
VCIKREVKRGKTYMAPKQIYSKALRGKAPTVPRIGEPYEKPLNPEMVIDTTKCSPQKSAQRILKSLRIETKKKR